MIPKIAWCYPGNVGDRMIYFWKAAQVVIFRERESHVLQNTMIHRLDLLP